MEFTDISGRIADQILRAALTNPRIRALIRLDMSTAAGRAGVSTTSLRRFLRGEALGAEAATSVASVFAAVED